MALPKEYRLKGKYYFRRVKRLGKSFTTPLFFLNIAPSKDPKELKFGFIVSTKIDKRAVERNRIRRLMSEAIRKRLDNFKCGYHIVIIARPAIVGKDTKTIDTWFEKVLLKTQLYNKTSKLGR